jgi:hypothetical protein
MSESASVLNGEEAQNNINIPWAKGGHVHLNFRVSFVSRNVERHIQKKTFYVHPSNVLLKKCKKILGNLMSVSLYSNYNADLCLNGLGHLIDFKYFEKN